MPLCFDKMRKLSCCKLSYVFQYAGNLVPVVYFNVNRIRSTFAAFNKRFQAHQKYRPFSTAMMHKLYRFLPMNYRNVTSSIQGKIQ